MPTLEPMQDPCQHWYPCKTYANTGTNARTMPTMLLTFVWIDER